MSNIELNTHEAGALAYALQSHIRNVDRLLARNAEWPRERRHMLALFWRLRRAALATEPDDIDDCENVYADDHDFF